MPILPGDIMIKYSDGSMTNKVIRIGQAFGSGQSKYTHAGIASASDKIIEMSGSGLHENALSNQYKYKVFRCKDADIASGALEAAKMMLANFSSGDSAIKYDAKGALRSISKNEVMRDGDTANTILDELLSSKGGLAFFCSGHVVLCYQMAMSQMAAQSDFPIQDFRSLDLESTCYQPAYLAKILKKSSNFTFAGKSHGAQLYGYSDDDETMPLLHRS